MSARAQMSNRLPISKSSRRREAGRSVNHSGFRTRIRSSSPAVHSVDPPPTGSGPTTCGCVRRRARVRAWALPRVLVLVLVIGLAGCGSSSSSSSASGSGSTSTVGHVHFAKTKFLLHAGLAFGAFHRYIYKPFRRGDFTPPLRHKLAIVKAGAAALFIYHEVKIALIDAQSSLLLSKLVSPLTALQRELGSLHQSLHGGHLDSSGINAANGNVTSIGSQSAHSGARVRDLATPALG